MIAAVVLLGAACGSATPAASVPVTSLQPGELPAPLDPNATVAPTTTIEVTTTVGQPLGADGSKVLMIGDSILASTAERYTRMMCDTLVPRSWTVAVEAEVSQGISFAREVQQARLDEGWDVGLIFLGTNRESTAEKYGAALDSAVVAFGDVPVILVTVTERNDQLRQINDQIRSVATAHPNVRIVDWAAITAAYPALLQRDGIHPTDGGRRALVDAIASVLGDPPDTSSPGACLRAQFVDDGEGLPSGVMPRPPSSTPRSTTTTATPTTRPSTSSTTPGGSSTSTSTPTGSTTSTTVKPATTTTTTKPTATTTATTTTVTTTAPTTTATTTPPTTTGQTTTTGG